MEHYFSFFETQRGKIQFIKTNYGLNNSMRIAEKGISQPELTLADSGVTVPAASSCFWQFAVSANWQHIWHDADFIHDPLAYTLLR